MTDTGYSVPVIQTHATPWTNGFVSQLQGIAAELSIAIVAGLSERDGALIYNSQVFVDRQGEIIAKYRKADLFASAPIAEHKCFSPGDRLSSFAFAGLRFGLSTATTFDFQSYIESSRWKTMSTLSSFLLPGLFRALNIFGRWRWHARSRIRVT